jgi:hypothetical protein
METEQTMARFLAIGNARRNESKPRVHVSQHGYLASRNGEMMARLESKLDACLEIMEAHEVETMRAPEN